MSHASRWMRCLLALAAWTFSGSVLAQAYPAKTIRVIIPAAAGDSCDTLSRLVGYKVAEKLGQQFAIDNRPGAGGQLGLQLIAQAPSDGCRSARPLISCPTRSISSFRIDISPTTGSRLASLPSRTDR